MTYQEYLQTEKWRHVSDLVKKRAGYRCQICNSPDRLSAHHRTYENIFNEINNLADLTCLCDAHHKLCHFPPTFHEISKNAVRFIQPELKPTAKIKVGESVLIGRVGYLLGVAKRFAMSDLDERAFKIIVKQSLMRGWDVNDIEPLAKMKSWPAFKSIIACQPIG